MESGRLLGDCWEAVVLFSCDAALRIETAGLALSLPEAPTLGKAVEEGGLVVRQRHMGAVLVILLIPCQVFGNIL